MASSAPAGAGAVRDASGAPGAADAGADAPGAAAVPAALRGLRTGLGYDVHALAEGRRLILGGVDIPHDRGLDGHSDADVLAHAIADALLGAVRGGDIGKLFPDTDPAYKDADSLKLLAAVAAFVRERGFTILDVDSVVAAQAPKLSPHRDQMRANLAAALGIPVENVGVKATTTEWLGFEGREEGISATATCLVCRL
ncbi:2-C-methyl-D-erythritol 2,4-cyclodiphosphate synthase [Adlercreutzia faecimuris]|uniref:2-C-methyl-D-erythritol 2,4-cyclodiphosphate synthase n=1 Tax=Adlercreutzia faecimuris TaxID=2897341 RepID=A0ABS9WJE7_9ACTN|nr:2-C-methyl-D-erythritol 2,4-cyclodiphosphate synthase [Adlercreutzia sp. JBNU-10]MCI2242900.1 2-C-methyl-D-erythritol 2,4-cyclodiphosphate synthase [Adlercreutzia sp. JBNU-10]